MTLQAQFERAVGYHQRGLLAEAEHLYREILRATPHAFEPRGRSKGAMTKPWP